jgi:hypothetical protein
MLRTDAYGRPVVVARHPSERRDRPRLQDGHVAARDRPLDILRAAQVRLDGVSQPCERRGLCGGQDGLGAPSSGDLHLGCALAHRRRHDGLSAQLEPFYPAGRLVEHQRVRGHPPTDDRLAEAPGGVDDDLVPRAAHRIDGEEDTGGVGRDQLLHHNRERDRPRVDAPARPVGQGSRRPQAGPTPAHGVEQRALAVDVQVGVLLTGETGGRQVLGDGRRAHRHSRLAQRAVRGHDSRDHVIGYRRRREQLTDRRRGALERLRIV